MRESCYMALFVLFIFGMTCHDAIYADVQSSRATYDGVRCRYYSEQCTVPYGTL